MSESFAARGNENDGTAGNRLAFPVVGIGASAGGLGAAIRLRFPKLMPPAD